MPQEKLNLSSASFCGGSGASDHPRLFQSALRMSRRSSRKAPTEKRPLSVRSANPISAWFWVSRARVFHRSCSWNGLLLTSNSCPCRKDHLSEPEQHTRFLWSRCFRDICQCSSSHLVVARGSKRRRSHGHQPNPRHGLSRDSASKRN